MAQIKTFKALLPRQDLVDRIAELPYDVVDRKEAKIVAKDTPYSFFHISKPEIDLSDNINSYSPEVYQLGKLNLIDFQNKEILKQDTASNLYLYTQIWGKHSQTGLVACVSTDDYLNNVIKKHELTRKDKEEDRTKHIESLNANDEPVFLFYKDDNVKKLLFDEALKLNPIYDFTDKNGVRNILRTISNKDLINSLIKSFADSKLYIADGHHRAAAAVNLAQRYRTQTAAYSANEFNYFLSVIFPDNQLKILAYNRVVRDLNKLSSKEFLSRLEKDFSLIQDNQAQPSSIHRFSMYLEHKWYSLLPKFDPGSDPLLCLDVSILQDRILKPILAINDPRTDKRIDFVGGVRGVEQLEKLVDSSDYKLAFSLYPTTIEQLIKVADTNNTMPPKSTWFEPKLRSGLFVHLF